MFHQRRSASGEVSVRPSTTRPSVPGVHAAGGRRIWRGNAGALTVLEDLRVRKPRWKSGGEQRGEEVSEMNIGQRRPVSPHFPKAPGWQGNA